MDGLTNVCEATSQSLDFDNFRPTHRKGKKLLAEKKRRARINNCLMRIRDIVCHGEEEKETDLDKMEKAEILEKTLDVLTKLRHNFDTSRKVGSPSSQKAMAVRYASGFSSCAEESIRYIQSSRLVPPEVKHQLQAHLRSIAHTMESRIQGSERVSFPHSYPTPPSVVIAPPQIVPLSSSATHLPSTSLSFMVDNGDGTARLQISPSENIDFHISHAGTSYTHHNDRVSSSSTSQMDQDKHPFIPSPIHSSTPVAYIDENRSDSPVVTTSHNKNFTPLIPVSNIEASYSHDHKENQPYLFHSNTSSSSENTQQSPSAFHKITPRHSKSASPKAQWIRKNEESCAASSSSSSSNHPSATSSSQYSPVSSMSSSIIIHSSLQSTPQALPSDHSQPIYNYHGYEPYPAQPHPVNGIKYEMPVVGDSPSEMEQQHTPIKAMDLCVKRNDSHNISPETMWRPW